MKLNMLLRRPLVFFDVETTGLDVATDRIVEISWYKVFPNGNAEGKTLRVKPTIIKRGVDALGKPYVQEEVMCIPPESTAIHGINDTDVVDCPTWIQIAHEVAAVLEGSDLAGYNSNHFDVPILAEEFIRAGIEVHLKRKNLIDAYTIFTRNEQRNLAAAYRFYCAKELTDAHTASADTMATFEVLVAQLERYDLPKTAEGLAEYSAGQTRFADFAGKIAYDEDGCEVFNFGQHKGKRIVDVFRRDKGYYGWLMGGNFPTYTKQIFTRIFLTSK